MTGYRVVSLAAVVGLVVSSGAAPNARGQQPPAASGPVASSQGAVVARYCSGCHNEKLKSGGIAFDALNLDSVGANLTEWEKVVQKLQARAMPPASPGRARPDEATYQALISHLETALDRVAAAKPDPGRTDTFHRLNRTEYQNAVRDLLAVDVDATALLPTDNPSYGFDNVNIGGLSPTLLDRYLAAAQKISRLAVGSPVKSPGGYTVVLPPDLTQNDQMTGLPFGTRGGTLFPYTFPQDGEYAIQIELARGRSGTGIMGLRQLQQIEVAIDGAQVKLFELRPSLQTRALGNVVDDLPADADPDLTVRVPVKAGEHTVLATFLKTRPALSTSQRQPDLTDIDANNRDEAAIFSVSITGPFGPTSAGETQSRKRIFVCRPAKAADEAGCAKTILSTLARRAYRRPVTTSDVDELLTFYKHGRATGGFETGVEIAIRAMLVSPEFLFRIEHDPASVAPNTVYRISDVDLASRLSFFLWSSIPDDTLLDAAVRGQLKDPVVLRNQVRRMLADPRSKALVKSFATQWLYLSNLSAATPDNKLFPNFDDNVRQAMRQETELFFESVKNEDRSALDLLTADYTFLNERLAKHYGIPGVYGSNFRRVTLPADSPRGGLLGQGSILTVTSYNDRTSPVRRGKWVLENLLGMPPPAPPPDVPPLKDNGVSGRMLSMRERMVSHRANPVCASCHVLMDPIGLATENFDAVGQWRDRAEDGALVDASGGFLDGSTFDGMSGLKKALLAHPDLFVATLTEKLLTYAVGRGLEGSDAAAVRAITRGARADDYRFSSIILGIAKSVPFQMRRASASPEGESSRP